MFVTGDKAVPAQLRVDDEFARIITRVPLIPVQLVRQNVRDVSADLGTDPM